ncbi:hypothetical protein J6590_103599 [Homalodisca vitripennis]|nr:hypothetical protein J6590_103599 [Homalodisca vitripennis]
MAGLKGVDYLRDDERTYPATQERNQEKILGVLPQAPVVPVVPVADNLVLLTGMTLAKQTRPDCPYCDSSVFPYCSDKLLHDACCCLNPYETKLPPQCKLADCSFLHANTCKEHRLITRCCCDRLLYIKR